MTRRDLFKAALAVPLALIGVNIATASTPAPLYISGFGHGFEFGRFGPDTAPRMRFVKRRLSAKSEHLTPFETLESFYRVESGEPGQILVSSAHTGWEWKGASDGE